MKTMNTEMSHPILEPAIWPDIIETQIQIRLAQLDKNKIEDIEKQNKTYDNLLVKMAKASEEERKKIRLFLRLKEMTPERLGGLYGRLDREKGLDIPQIGFKKSAVIRNVMLDYINQFSAEQQKALMKSIAYEQEIPYHRKPIKDLWNIDSITPKTTIQAININLPHEIMRVTAKNIGDLLTEELLKHPVWNKLFIDKINQLTEKDIK